MARTLGIVILTYNTRELLAECLRSIQPDLVFVPTETIVVDNGSADGTIPMLQESFPWVRIIANPDNRGAAVGFNQGVRFAHELACEMVLLVNSDIVFTPGVIGGMYDHLVAYPDVDGVCVGLHNPDGTRQKFRRSL